MKRALLVVDLQNDFFKSGALPVPEAEEILPRVARLLTLPFDKKIASQDWHPAGHCSFASVGGLWPDHCIQGSHGAQLTPPLDHFTFDFIVKKGIDQEVDSYSAFFDNEKRRSTGLEGYLRSEGIHELYVVGLATEYCVFHSCMDAVQLGFSVKLIVDACQGLSAEAVLQCSNQMRQAGVEFLTVDSCYV